MDNGASAEMPRFKSHKTVWALEIASLDGQTSHFVDPAYAPIEAEPNLFLRYTPQPGDFYIVYSDGFKSFSPRKAFLEGYSPEKA